jgi:cbb3-type cytochrome oxidase subunit 3
MREAHFHIKGIIIIFLILLAGLASAYTPEQQTALDNMNLGFKLGIAYDKAIQGQDVTEYNTLVDEYNAWIQQHFGKDASLLLKSKINQSSSVTTSSNSGTTYLTQLSNSGYAYLTQSFNSSSDLSKFGKPQRYVANYESEQGMEYDLSQQAASKFIDT